MLQMGHWVKHGVELTAVLTAVMKVLSKAEMMALSKAGLMVVLWGYQWAVN
jgi:hypothetical protein